MLVQLLFSSIVLILSCSGNSHSRSRRDVEIFDPMWSQQWYLHRDSGSSYGADMNAKVAWNYATGSGITIGVVDGGIIPKSEDITVRDDLKLDFHKQSAYNYESTGTKVAGAAAGKKNHKCGVGIAFDARVVDIRLFNKSSSVTDEMRAKALSHKLTDIHIYVNNWSANENSGDNPSRLFPMSELSSQALYKGIREGRDGKGAIYIWASGMGGINGDDGCTYDEYVNNMYTIAVAGIREDSRKLLRGESCSAIIVSAFSADSGATGSLDNTATQQALKNIVTPSSKSSSGCDTDFAESGAAAAMVTGAVALALQVNGGLTWRDVQHLLIRTSNPYIGFRVIDPQHRFVTNAANFKYSPAFGFGLLDIGKMVKLAKKWPQLPANQTCIVPGYVIPNKNQIPQYFLLHVSRYCKIEYIEHIELRFRLTYTNKRGRVRIRLESPKQTESVMITGRESDTTLNELNWQSVSYMFWGERPQGQWRIHVDDASPPTGVRGSGTLYEYTLIIHGMNERYLPEYQGPHDDLDMGSGMPWWGILIIVLVIVFAIVGVLVFLRVRHIRRERGVPSSKPHHKTKEVYGDTTRPHEMENLKQPPKEVRL